MIIPREMIGEFVYIYTLGDRWFKGSLLDTGREYGITWALLLNDNKFTYVSNIVVIDSMKAKKEDGLDLQKTQSTVASNNATGDERSVEATTGLCEDSQAAD